MNMPTTKQRDGRYQALRALADGWKLEWEFEYREAITSKWWSLKDGSMINSSTNLRIIPDENGWLPWYATKDSVCPVDGTVDYLMPGHKRPGDPMLSNYLNWSNKPAGQIIHYRPHKERVLVKTVQYYDDGSEEVA